jgi:hypothetical protein
MPAYCSYPTSFDMLWQIALGCGFILLLETIGLYLRRHLLKLTGWTSLILCTLLFSLSSFVLAFVSSRFVLTCGPSQADQATYQMLMKLQSAVIVGLIITCILVLIGLGPLLQLFPRFRQNKYISDQKEAQERKTSH